MSSFDFTLWYYGDALQKNRRFYELIKEYRCFELSYFYGPQDKDEKTHEKFTDMKKIDEMFYEAETFYPGISIVMGGNSLEVMMCVSCSCGSQCYGTVNFNVVSLEIKEAILNKKNISSQTLENIFVKIVDIYDPIYGIFDNSDIIFDLMESEETYKPNEYIQSLFWGNYYGKEYCTCKGIKKLISSDLCISNKLKSGYFIKLSEFCDDYNSCVVNEKRNKLIKYIVSPVSKRHLNKFKLIDK